MSAFNCNPWLACERSECPLPAVPVGDAIGPVLPFMGRPIAAVQLPETAVRDTVQHFQTSQSRRWEASYEAGLTLCVSYSGGAE